MSDIITVREYFTTKANILPNEFDLLEKYIIYKDYSRKTKIITRGDICNNAYYVEKGLLRSYSIDNNNKEHIIQFAPEGWILGDKVSEYFNQEAIFQIEAIEDSEIAILTPDFFQKAIELTPNFSSFNNLLLHNHIKNLQKRIHDLMAATAEQRYLNFIELYPDLLSRVPQMMIASYLGITPESLSRVRKEIATKGKN